MVLNRQLVKFAPDTRIAILLFFLLFIPILSGYGIEQKTPDKTKNKPYFEKRIAFEHISLEQGLSQSIVRCILQDSKGFLWFGTEGGLNRYDGFNFEVYEKQPFDSTCLSDSDIRYIYESPTDPEFIWIGTRYGGLNRLDRKTEQFIHLKNIPDDSTSLSHNWVHYIYEDSEGDFWIITADGGIDRLNRHTGKFARFRHNPDDPHSLSHNYITTLYEDSNGILWLGTPSGLNKFERKTNHFIRYTHNSRDPNSLSYNLISSIVESSKEPGILWIGTANRRTLEGGGLNRFNTKTSEFRHYTHHKNDPGSISNNFVSQVHEDSQGRIWLGSIGLIQFDEKTGTFTTYYLDPLDPTSKTNSIQSMFEDGKGNLWIQTMPEDDGLFLFNPQEKNFIHYRHDADNSNSLSVDEVITIYEDRSGVLWLGTDVGGINKLDLNAKKFVSYQADPKNPNSLSNNIVRSIWEDKSGILWVGVADSGLNKINRETGECTHYFPQPGNPNSLSDDDVWSIYEDHSGIMWVGTHRGGLNRFDPVQDSFTHFQYDENDPNSLSDDIVWTIYESPHEPGVLWIGTEQGGMNRFDIQKRIFKHYQHDPADPQSLSNNFVKAIYEDSAGTLWIGTIGGGLNQFNRESETFKVYLNNSQNPNSLSENYINVIYGDKNGILWIGTMSGGLNRFDSKKEIFTVFTEENSELCDNIVYGILEDENSNLWLSTNNGLCKFNPKNNSFYTYTTDDGLQSSEFNGGAYFKSQSGEMFFGGINGFNSFYPDHIQHNPIIPQVALIRFTLFNEPVPIGGDSPLKSHINEVEKIKLEYWQNDISIEYIALHFNNPQKNQYAYKLENYENNWRQVRNGRTATYTNLDPGKYIFKVKASNGDGIWNEEGACVRIIITPPFWQTLWFKILAGILFVLSVYGMIVWRTKKIHMKKRALEIQVREKTEAAQALHDAFSEVERLKSRLQAENIYLQNEINLEHNFDNIITNSNSFKRILQQLEQVASTDSTVLINGETGTGKELLARAIHSLSKRKTSPLIKVDCATLPPNLIESELFGHEKGAFTGAMSKKPGRFEIADKGTIFLDEIGEMPLELQPKLLCVLQEGEIQRIGSNQTIRVDVRVISATNRNLEKEIQKGNFREDLFFRLNVFPIHIPSLRERKEDIPLLVKYFVKKYNTKLGGKVENIPQSVIDTLQNYHWPGNVRELENIIQRAIILSRKSKLELGDWVQRKSIDTNNGSSVSLEENERRHILKVLEMTNWRVSGEKGAAKILNLNPKTLFSRMQKLGIHHKKSNFSEI